MDKKQFQDEIKQRIAETDPGRLNGYIDMFDRLLLYNMASSILPPEAIEEMLIRWEQAVKAAINTESCMRTHFLESTPQGRMAKRQKQPDGEDFRQVFSHTLDTAKLILSQNLQHDDEDNFEFEDSDI